MGRLLPFKPTQLEKENNAAEWLALTKWFGDEIGAVEYSQRGSGLACKSSHFRYT
ncbi:hypothetical protein [Vibrio caribbeanicus]|uniref:hypothetical protein n=1 Tax=Vibrio caribbeanicus TaxID=701175 RepID=UPI0022850C79|nr:hypothetical protein [Vibrio caribbeanicus]MCY9843746.1 hypothetical protein [Vibrio caribbeanicus]